jgi:hypothetical protein
MRDPMFALSAALIQDLEVDDIQEDFVFRVGDGHLSAEYRASYVSDSFHSEFS